MSVLDAAIARGEELVEKIAANGVAVTTDPRSATPPCVLIPPPNLRADLACGATAEWQLHALAPGPGNPDAVHALSTLIGALEDVVPWERIVLEQYALSADNPPLPAYRIEFEEGI